MQLEACVHEYGRFRTHTTFACWLYLKVFKGCELSSYCRRGWLTTVLRIYPIQEKRLHIEWNDTSELTIDEFLLLLNLIRIIWYYVDRTKECWRTLNSFRTSTDAKNRVRVHDTVYSPYFQHILRRPPMNYTRGVGSFIIFNESFNIILLNWGRNREYTARILCNFMSSVP